LKSHGIAAHLIASDRGKNAITLLAKTMISITSSDSHQGKLFSFLYDMTSNTPERTIGTVTLIRSDDRQVTMEADYRYSIFTDDNERNIQDGTKAIEYLQSKSRQYGLKMEVMENTHPVFIPDDSPLVTQLMREYKKITGSETKSYTMSGGTYAKLLPNAVAYGPSIEGKTIFHEQGCPPDTGDFHQPDESVSIEELLKAMEIYCRTLPEISIK
jgi:acetylornithine deacetylase/succinyl-diaminopimelate desuccinylase-like protein